MFRKEQANMRNDVLIIESGEIRIPSDVDWRSGTWLASKYCLCVFV